MEDQNGPQGPQNQAAPAEPVMQPQPGVAGVTGQDTQSAQQPMQVMQPTTQPPKRSKKWLVIGGVILLILVALIGGGVFAGYAYLNNKPEKVLADALANTLSDITEKKPASTIGELMFESKGDNSVKAKLTFDTKTSGENGQGTAELTVDFSGKTYKIKTSARVFGEEEFYIKVENLRQTVNSLISSQPEFETYSAMINPIIAKIDNRWIKITKDDITELGVADEQTVDKCSAALESIRISGEDKEQLKKLFNDNQFIIASETFQSEEVAEENSFHYKLDFNNKAAENFAKQVIALKSFETVKKDCGINEKDIEQGFKQDSESNRSIKNEPKPVLELWVGKKSRRPTKFRVSANNKELTLDFNTQVKLGDQSVVIEKPASSVSIKELQAEFEKLVPSASSTNSSVSGFETL